MRAIDSYLVFDFETTGLDPETDRIIQVGLCEVTRSEVARRAGWLVNQSVDIPAGATAVHGIRTADIRSRGQTPKHSLRVLLKALDSAPHCMGHNIHRFDVAFLRAECNRIGYTMPNVGDYVDTAALYKGWKLGQPKRSGQTHRNYANGVLSIRVRGLKYSLETCTRDLGIKLNPSTLHDASADAYATHLVYKALSRRL